MNKQLLCLGLVAAVLMAGCGSTPTSTSSKLRRSPLQGAAPLAGPGMMPAGGQMGMQPGAGGGDVQGLLAAVRQAQATQQGFTATLDTYEKGPKGDEENQTLKVSYKRPSTLKIHITKGSGQSNDAKVLWTGGGDLKVKPSFLPFSVSKSISDEAIKTRNGWTIKDTCPAGILDSMLDPAAQVQIMGEQNLMGKQLVMCNVNSPRKPKGATHEIIGVDKANMLPAFREVYKGQTVMYRLAIKSMKMGVPSSSEFEI